MTDKSECCDAIVIDLDCYLCEGCGVDDLGCQCPVCSTASRAFLHHLFRCGEVTAPVLATLHNLRFYLDFMRDLREAIASGSLAEIASSIESAYVGRPAEDPGS